MITTTERQAPTFEELCQRAHGGRDKHFFRRMLSDVQFSAGRVPASGQSLGISLEQLAELADDEARHYCVPDDGAAARAEALRREAAKLETEAREIEDKRRATEGTYRGLCDRRAYLLGVLDCLTRRVLKLQRSRVSWGEAFDRSAKKGGSYHLAQEFAQRLAAIDIGEARIPALMEAAKTELAQVEAKIALMEAGPIAKALDATSKAAVPTKKGR